MAFVNKYYISDLHLLHDNILHLQPRPFSSIEEHDEIIIKNWNSVVKNKTDRVVINGDFAFSLKAKAEKVREYFFRMNGEKELVLGNHDVRKDGTLHPTLAELPWRKRPEWMSTSAEDGKNIIICHYALKVWQGQNKGDLHFFGHSHGKVIGDPGSRDIGCDLPDVNFTPRTYAELIGGIEQRSPLIRQSDQ